ncbi:MAG: LD-carboxypeptidase [Thermodesulfobacteriaceae bacterium]|nr:LD-carboxypeptidase [Thermodesulfobacteriaceae bacterium]MDW8136524.1 LD-carboxypeptidase [Thermodesulfobacterium sp.]
MEKKIKIALFSPSSPPSPSIFEKALKILKSYGLSYKSFVDFSSEPPSFRAFLLFEILSTGEFSHIWATRGGFGAIKLLPYLEELFNSSTKRFSFLPFLIGFSDITILHLYFYKKFKKLGFHAPMVLNLPNLSKKNLELLQEVVFRGKGNFLKGKAFIEGEGEGILIGGNLTTLASLCGTPYFSLEEPFLLFIEDVKEPLYRLERSFLQILFTLKKDHFKGLILGSLGKVDPLEFLEQIKEFLPENLPIGYNFPFGHIKNNYPLIIGKRTYLRVKNSSAELHQEGIPLSFF